MRNLYLTLFFAFFASSTISAQYFYEERDTSIKEIDYHDIEYRNMTVVISDTRVFVYDIDNYYGSGMSFSGGSNIKSHYSLMASDGVIMDGPEAEYHVEYYKITAGDSLKLYYFTVDTASGVAQFEKYTFLGKSRKTSSTFSNKSFIEPLTIFPNPVGDQINLKGINESYNYIIYDLNGNAVVGGQENNSILNVWFLSEGQYILTLNTKDKYYSTQFIKK